MPGALTVHENDPILKNVYDNGAIKAKSIGDPIDINGAYRQIDVGVPVVAKMDALRSSIEKSAGRRASDRSPRWTDRSLMLRCHA